MCSLGQPVMAARRIYSSHPSIRDMLNAMMDTQPNFETNACAGFSDEDREALWQAAKALVESRGIVIRVTEFLGVAVDRFGGNLLSTASGTLGDGWRDRVNHAVEEALRRGYRFATM